MIQNLNETVLQQATQWLIARDTALARVFRQYGYPPLWAREPGFSTLVHIILEQQVSLASANAAFQRLQQQLGVITPSAYLTLDDNILRSIGFSRQKTSYARALAQEILDGHLDLPALATLPDELVGQRLKKLKGIGDWTVDIYLSECLLRPDILPKGDIAMQEAFRVLKGLSERPVHEAFVKQTLHWRPWRSVGSRMLWHFYLCERNGKQQYA
ncbi:MAG: DNA-3-methyladenine glycosylase 2 family protein [Lewinellaceae bacterium]|nr:DNA-3-methyladenine glycosylase 2 family protein [Lewinellaceae bacterium]MCB9333233.1 DNA-3-methyladenine glycosylase 2 family protein [Lewinellaceae bacterium]